jgi:CO/xanthine dehydrogenase Mo-binding subunit
VFAVLDPVTNTGIKSTSDFPSVSGTSGSGTSEACVDATLKACAKLLLRLRPHAVSGATWMEVLAAATAAGVDLRSSVEGAHLHGSEYYIYCAGATEMELDVLTGEYTILRADLVYDCGIALNPALDIGQLEGCYMMAAGMVLMEDQQHSLVDGRLIGAGAAVDDCLARQSVSLRTLSVLKCRDVGLQAAKCTRYTIGIQHLVHADTQ